MKAGSIGLRYNPALDGLRGVAIALVILSHAHVPLFDGAFFGVDVFFVLSGFLITSLLLIELQAEGQLDYWRFYRRRLLRLMPALLLFLAVYVLVAPLLWPGQTDAPTDALVSALYLADYGIAFFDQPASLLHMWSLSVEEHFYLIWPPLLALLVARCRRGHVWRAIAVLWLLAALWRLLCVAWDQPFYQVFFRFDTRATGLLAGALLAALLHEQPGFIARARRHLPGALWLPLAVPLLMGLGWDSRDALSWGMPAVEGAAVVALVAVQRQRGMVYRMLSLPALVKLGQLSYGVYLWHYPVVRYLRADLPWPWVVLLGGAISLALAALSYHGIERWALRWRDRAPAPARRHPPVSAPAH